MDVFLAIAYEHLMRHIKRLTLKQLPNQQHSIPGSYLLPFVSFSKNASALIQTKRIYLEKNQAQELHLQYGYTAPLHSPVLTTGLQYIHKS